MDSLKKYQSYLRYYYVVCSELHDVLDLKVMVKSASYYGASFQPTEFTVRQQMAKWPPHVPVWPPAMWVDPSRGVLDYSGEKWRYLFHGQGLSFVQERGGRDVSLEYTSDGNIGITPENFLLFLEGLNDGPDLFSLRHESDALFSQCILLEFLLEQPARGGSDSETFLIQE